MFSSITPLSMVVLVKLRLKEEISDNIRQDEKMGLDFLVRLL